MNKILSKVSKMPYNQFLGNEVIMFGDDRITLIKVILGTTYTDKPLVISGQAIDVIKTFGDGVEVAFKEKQLVIKKDKNVCRSNYIDRTINFPQLTAFGDIVVKRDDLIRGLQFTSKSAGDRLSGINISKSGIVASNGYKAYFKGEQNEEFNVTISNEFINLVLKTFSEQEDITIKFDAVRSWVESDNIIIVGSIINMPYPKTNSKKKQQEDYVVINFDLEKVKSAFNILKLEIDNNYFDFLVENKIIYCCTNDFKLEVGKSDDDLDLPSFNKEVLNLFNLLDNVKIKVSTTSNLMPIRMESDDRTIIVVPIRKER